MTTMLRRSAALVALLALGACAGDSSIAPDADLLSLASVDPSVGAEAGQAGTLGLTMDPTTTFDGALGGAASCAYVAASGRVECAPVTRGGLTFTRSIGFRDAAGAAQPARNDATVSANTRIGVTGSITTPRGPMSVTRASDLTVSGLGRASTTHTINGLETGRTSGTLTMDRGGSVEVSETTKSETENVVVRVPATAGSYPLSGTTTRSGTTTAKRTGSGETRSSSWSERVTYTGTSVVNVTITRDGVTRTCTRDLAARTNSCS